MKNKRVLYFDILKVLSSFAVVLIHVISQFWYDLSPNSINFIILTIIDGLVRFVVPIYFMISGALFLNEDKKITISDVFKKYILRIFIIYIFWNMVYSVGTSIFLYNIPITFNGVINNFINTILGYDYYHLSFLVLIIGFYLSVPIIKLITKKENKKLIEYFIIILFIFISVNPILSKFFGINIKYNIMFNGYILYAILGYYFHSFDISRRTKSIIYILGIIGFLVTSFGTIYYSNMLGYPNEYLFSYLTPNVVFLSSFIFIVFKDLKIKSKKVIDVITFLSKNYFGIYLIHGLVIGLILKTGLLNLQINLVLLILFAGVLTFIISLIVTYLISKVKILKKLVSTS